MRTRAATAVDAELQASGAECQPGLLTSLSNPKIAVLFTSLLPQFIAGGTDPLPGRLLLGRAFNLLALLWLVGSRAP